ncbi:bifunctional riboflavin kinase/FAD synthetase [Ideonella sp. B7]|uniref:bifunctional riboflavin kinase/FAD synthetase n=1 Tax=Ideonella benzenivorans TaxID=2831643 RepID=UPI001CECED2F|nr:bifunctional riboflavin kinase/FAD synthetase [Ideonella benzenivorans]MCA6217758.1 bifunctional riboflavin kinase/FAD synthetase [Ideonella benzenivorans]
MRVFRGHHPSFAAGPGCALTIGNFDGVHRGHQAMLALLNNEARLRGLRSCVMTFEPHPRDWFAQKLGKPEAAPLRIATLRDKLQELEHCGVDDVVLMRFDDRLASLSPDDFIRQVLVNQLKARYVLVGDDFRFGAKRAGDYALLDAAGNDLGFDVARMMSYEVHGLRVSSSAVREALAAGDMRRAATLLGRPYCISGHVVHGRKLGRDLGFRTLNLRFPSHRPAAQGIFVVRVHGLGPSPLPGVASLGVRPSVEDAGRVLLEVHCLDWPAHIALEGGYARLLRVELMHKLHDERRYPSLEALRAGIAQDVVDATAWWRAYGV